MGGPVFPQLSTGLFMSMCGWILEISSKKLKSTRWDARYGWHHVFWWRPKPHITREKNLFHIYPSKHTEPLIHLFSLLRVREATMWERVVKSLISRRKKQAKKHLLQSVDTQMLELPQTREKKRGTWHQHVQLRCKIYLVRLTWWKRQASWSAVRRSGDPGGAQVIGDGGGGLLPQQSPAWSPYEGPDHPPPRLSPHTMRNPSKRIQNQTLMAKPSSVCTLSFYSWHKALKEVCKAFSFVCHLK